MTTYNPRPFNFFWERPKGIIVDPVDWSPDLMRVEGQVCAVLKTPDDETIEVFETKNIVTTAGSNYYAERAVGTDPMADALFTDGTSGAVFDGKMYLYNGSTGTPAAGSNYSAAIAGGTAISTNGNKDMVSGYPKINDADADNTGSGTYVVTYYSTWVSGEATNLDIDNVFISNPSPAATTNENILMWAQLSPAITKGTSDTLKVFVNHTLAGA